MFLISTTVLSTWRHEWCTRQLNKVIYFFTKVRISEDSSVLDHCSVYGLSDPTNESFRQNATTPILIAVVSAMTSTSCWIILRMPFSEPTTLRLRTKMRLLFILTLSINLSVACLTNEGVSTDIMRRELHLSGYVCAKPLQELMYGKYKVVNASGEM